jgi:hypothetical protein
VNAGAVSGRRPDATWSSTVQVRSLWRESSGELAGVGRGENGSRRIAHSYSSGRVHIQEPTFEFPDAVTPLESESEPPYILIKLQ